MSMNKYKCNKCKSIIQEGYEISEGYFRYCENCNEDMYEHELTALPVFNYKDLSDEDAIKMFNLMAEDNSFNTSISYYKQKYYFGTIIHGNDKAIYIKDHDIYWVEYSEGSILTTATKKLIVKFYKKYLNTKKQ